MMNDEKDILIPVPGKLYFFNRNYCLHRYGNKPFSYWKDLSKIGIFLCLEVYKRPDSLGNPKPVAKILFADEIFRINLIAQNPYQLIPTYEEIITESDNL